MGYNIPLITKASHRVDRSMEIPSPTAYDTLDLIDIIK